jgi:anti-sigma factor RsiW
VEKHLSDIELEAYRSRSATPEQFLAINDHLNACDQCRREFDSPDKVKRTYEAFRKTLRHQAAWPEHLTFVQLEGFVDGTASADTIRQVLSHMAECPECRDEIRDLKGLKDRTVSQKGSKPSAVLRAEKATWWQEIGRAHV